MSLIVITVTSGSFQHHLSQFRTNQRTGEYSGKALTYGFLGRGIARNRCVAGRKTRRLDSTSGSRGRQAKGLTPFVPNQTSMAMYRRKQLLVSDEVQHSLLMRLTIHWVLFVLANLVTLAIWTCWIELPGASSEERYAALVRVSIPVLACSLVIVPVFLYDITKLSNQFAGPINRIRSTLSRYLANGKIEEVHLRRNDFWQSLAADFNRLVTRHQPTPPVAQATVKETYTDA